MTEFDKLMAYHAFVCGTGGYTDDIAEMLPNDWRNVETKADRDRLRSEYHHEAADVVQEPISDE